MAIRITPEQRRRIVEKARKDQEKKMQLEQKEKDKQNEQEKKKRFDYPPVIATIAKRIKRVDPWNTVACMPPADSVLVVYYKLKQRSMENLRIAVNAKHRWVEFQFADEWYIFDISAVKNIMLGKPVKNKYEEDVHEWYQNLTQYFDLDKYIETFDDEITIDKDEAKIIAMEDDGLNTALMIKYF